MSRNQLEHVAKYLFYQVIVTALNLIKDINTSCEQRRRTRLAPGLIFICFQHCNENIVTFGEP